MDTPDMKSLDAQVHEIAETANDALRALSDNDYLYDAMAIVLAQKSMRMMLRGAHDKQKVYEEIAGLLEALAVKYNLQEVNRELTRTYASVDDRMPPTAFLRQ